MIGRSAGRKAEVSIGVSQAQRGEVGANDVPSPANQVIKLQRPESLTRTRLVPLA